jgi:hypothetical protein
MKQFVSMLKLILGPEMTEEQQQMIQDCLKRETKLSSWELDFINNIMFNDSLSKKQAETLDNIWEKVTA